MIHVCRIAIELTPYGPVQATRDRGLLAYLIVKKGGSYAKYTPEQKALIAKRETEHSVVASYRRFYLILLSKVLRADPLPTRADSIAIHDREYHCFQRFTKLLPLEKFALYASSLLL